MTYNISKATQSDLTNTVQDWKVTPMSTDGISNQKETTWQNPNWNYQWGYFNENADLKSAILMKAIWICGRGWTTDVRTKVILEHISGWGKDTFDDIMFNMQTIKRIAGDAFCEIIRDKETKVLTNLKPLDPSTIRIVLNDQGIIQRYEQVQKIPGNSNIIKFEPQDILHLSNDRLADQIHGISVIDALEPVLKAESESFTDIKRLMHTTARPMIMFKLKTDDQPTINAFVAKMDKALSLGENIYIPDDTNSVEYEVIQLNPNQLIMNWRDDIRNKFYRTIGLPQVVPGASGGSTESESKVIYLAFEQIVEKEQRELEMQLWSQLGIKINFEPPSSLATDLQNDQKKDVLTASQPSDLQAGAGR